MVLRYVLVGVLSFLIVACSQNLSVPVALDYDTTQPYIDVKTYTWLEQQQYTTSDSTLSSPMFNSGIMLSRVKAAVDKELTTYGIKKVNQLNKPDIMLSIRLSTEDKIDFDSFYDFYGYYPYFGSSTFDDERHFREYHRHAGLSNSVRQYVAGTLVIDFVNTKTKQLICRASSERPVSHLQSPEARSAFINETVAAMIKRFAEVREQALQQQANKNL